MDDMLEKIRAAGIVGCGGAGFPTHRKLDTTADHFIINGAECEPLLRTDRYLMRHFAEELVETAEKIGAHLSAQTVAIALKHTYHEEIESLQNAIDRLASRVTIAPLDNFYPAGDEQMVVREVTGKIVPPGGIPLEVRTVVSNVATVLAVRDALNNKAFTRRHLTVAGAVAQPVILQVPFGTSFLECISLAGGALDEPYAVISGGPMMGKVLSDEELEHAVVTKTTSGILVVPAANRTAVRADLQLSHIISRARSSCIQCSYCTQMCPRYGNGHPLQPHRIMRKLAYAESIETLLEDNDAKQAMICCECGICEDYACPMSLQPRKINVLLKQAFAKAGIRYERAEGAVAVREDIRKIPSKRVASRLELLQYYDCRIDRFAEYTPTQVKVPLKQHIGAPSNPVVQIGMAVQEGQLIADCPKEVLGAKIHAAITGTVTEVDKSYITIQTKEGA